MKKWMMGLLMLCAAQGGASSAWGCTGIALVAKDGSRVQGRTIEWARERLPSYAVCIPRGHEMQMMLPDGKVGSTLKARWGAVGLAVSQPDFIAEGINERGLSVGLFFFPRYGSYESYQPARASETVGDLQLTAWMLTQCATIDEVKQGLRQLHIVGLNEGSVIHWRLADAEGRQEVLEIVGGEQHWFTNTVGVLANGPGFAWHLTNLNNYVNLYPGDAPIGMVGNFTLRPISGSSGMLGLPGDMTSPSRFVRAAMLRQTAPIQPDGWSAVRLCFHLLNSFDVPVGLEHPMYESPDMLSATQWTSVIDLTALRVYYRTAQQSTIRCIDLHSIDFSTAAYASCPLDDGEEESVKMLRW